jgi:hypothetical protein
MAMRPKVTPRAFSFFFFFFLYFLYLDKCYVEIVKRSSGQGSRVGCRAKRQERKLRHVVQQRWR